MDRRGFITGMAGILAAGVAPAVLPSGIIMPIRKLWTPIVPMPGQTTIVRTWFEGTPSTSEAWVETWFTGKDGKIWKQVNNESKVISIESHETWPWVIVPGLHP